MGKGRDKGEDCHRCRQLTSLLLILVPMCLLDYCWGQSTLRKEKPAFFANLFSIYAEDGIIGERRKEGRFLLPEDRSTPAII